MPTMPICPNGFWSNHSKMNSRAYWRVKVNRVGRMSRSSIEAERSNNRTRCRMIDRRIAAAGACSLRAVLDRVLPDNAMVGTFSVDPSSSNLRRHFAGSQLHLLGRYPMNAYKMLPRCMLAAFMFKSNFKREKGTTHDILCLPFSFLISLSFVGCFSFPFAFGNTVGAVA